MRTSRQAEPRPRLQRAKVTLITTAVTVVVAVACLGYATFISAKINEESTNHLTEVYAQVNDKFSTLVAKNWNLLSGWARHIDVLDESDKEALREFLVLEQEKWSFTDFYFLRNDGSYLTIDGESGYIDLGAQLEPLMLDGENVVVDGTLPTGAALTVFAVPATESSYQGFAYSAVAVSYNNADMETALDVAAFDGHSDCLVTYEDGRVLFSAKVDDSQPYNYLTHLEENSDLTAEEFARLRGDFATGQAGVAQYRVDGTDWYLAYQPVGFQDWMMLGAVPKDVVNAAMNQIQWVTVVAFSSIFVLIGIVSVVFLRWRSKRAIALKEAEIQHLENLFTTLAGNTEDIFVLFSADDYAVEYVSPNVERMLGIPTKEVRASIRALDASNVGNSRLPSGEELRQVSRGRCWQDERERVHRRTGERRWYEESVYHESEGGTEKFILVLTDRTQERENEQILRQALDIAAHASEAKSTFLANMSHDIRTPLNGVTGMIDFAQRNLESREKVADSLDKARSSADHLLSLINDILDMSKIESGQMTLHEEVCNLDRILDEVKSIIKPQADAKRQEFVVESSANVRHRTFVGDSLRIRQILLNLLSNAVKYTHEGGRVSLTVDEHDPAGAAFTRMRFTVEDNGIGMPPEFLERLFDPFERSDQTVVENIQGTGLGMPISKSLAEAMGGAISVESEVGKGSTFTLVLDLKIGDDAEAAAGPSIVVQPERYEFEGRRFLLAEDNEINALVFIGLVGEEGLGARVDWAENGQQAVEMFASKPAGFYEAIFMDVMMPVMGGYAATAAIRALPREDASEVRIVALTANAFAEDVQAALDAGMNAHVGKPIVLDELEQALLRLA